MIFEKGIQQYIQSPLTKEEACQYSEVSEQAYAWEKKTLRLLSIPCILVGILTYHAIGMLPGEGDMFGKLLLSFIFGFMLFMCFVLGLGKHSQKRFPHYMRTGNYYIHGENKFEYRNIEFSKLSNSEDAQTLYKNATKHRELFDFEVEILKELCSIDKN